MDPNIRVQSVADLQAQIQKNNKRISRRQKERDIAVGSTCAGLKFEFFLKEGES